MRSYVLSGDTAHYDKVIEGFEALNVKIIPAFAGGLDGRPAIEKYFIGADGPSIDVLVSLTGFSLVGGPAYNDTNAAVKTCQTLMSRISRRIPLSSKPCLNGKFRQLGWGQ